MVLKGSNGYDVGSPEYFKNINQSSIIGDIMWEFSNGSHCVDYKDALDKLCKSIVDVIYEVHADLKRYAEVLSFFPKEEREETLKFLEKINEVLKFGYSGESSKFDSCKSYLTLSSYDTRRKSYESMSRVEEAAKRVKNGTSYFSFYEGYEILKKVTDYGMSFMVGTDPVKKAYLDEILDGAQSDLIFDVCNYIKYEKEKSYIKGKCNRELLSRDYIEKLTSEAISTRLYDKLKYERSYYEVINKDFLEIVGVIENDLDKYTGDIHENNVHSLILASNNLDKLLNTFLNTKVSQFLDRPFSVDKERERSAKVILDNSTIIKLAGEIYNIDPAIIASCIYTEQYLNVDIIDFLTDWVGKYSILDTSIGIGQVKVSTAKKIEDEEYIEETNGIESDEDIQEDTIRFKFHSFINDKMRNFNIGTRLHNDNDNIMYVAAYLRRFVDQWEEEFSLISSSPDILGTLFNLGDREPNSEPQTNSFGREVGKNYNYMRQLLKIY